MQYIIKQYTYLLIDLGCIIVPFLVSFHPKLKFYLKWKNFLLANIIVSTFFLIWDEVFTHKGVWGFNPDYVTGFYIGSMPIEEVLFFICIPYACVFTYHCFRILIPQFRFKEKVSFNITIAMTAFLVVMAAFNIDKAYTFYTAIFTSIFLIFSRFYKINLSSVYTTYLAVIPFFLISNGYLTGSFTPEPIVWYNDAENLAIRVFTIPVEDFVYGFLMVAGNIVITYWKELKV